jgi:membrane fusion protein (multidrug efflux system)
MTALSAGRAAPGADADSIPARPRLSRMRAAVLLALAAASLAAAWQAAEWWTTGRFIVTTDDAYVGGDITAIAPHIAGFVAEVPVTDNQPVRAGQLLARIDPRDTRAALDRAQAALEGRRAALAGLQAQSLLQQSVIAQAAADLQAKTARAAFAQADGARYTTLALTSAGSRQDAERARVIDQEAGAAVRAAQAGLDAARLQLRVLDARISEARAAAAQAEAERRRAELDVGYTEIRSPIDGFVGNRDVRAGAYVAPGSTLLSIIPASGLWVDANFKEDQLGAIAPGQPATLSADAAPGILFHGHVLSLAPGTGAVFSIIPLENATGNFTKIVQRVPVRIALDAEGATLSRLRPGLSAVVSIDTGAAK